PGYTPAEMSFEKMSQKERNAMAKKLFAEAGYGPNNPLKLDLLYNTSENHKKIAIAISNMWKTTLGALDVPRTNKEWKVYLAAKDNKDYQIGRAAWIGDYADASNFLDQWVSDAGPRNSLGYNNPKFDELMKKAAVTSNPEERAKVLHEAEEMFLADVAMIPIYHYTNTYLVSKKVEGWTENVLGYNQTKYLSIKG